ncbi:MAG: hypothetical protein OXB84_06565, partial [Halobacteriovoraceae bacterium]|nr:hypothetical protein [Halobacteriovoraceae bacterium]
MDFKKLMGKVHKKKIIILLCTAFFVFFTTAVFITLKKISPEKIRNTVRASLQKTFPSANVEIGEIDFSLGFTINLNVEEISASLSLKNNKERLFSLKNISVHIPLRSILFGGGAIEAVFLHPEFFYSEMKAGNNWALAMKNPQETSRKKKREHREEITKKSDSSSLVVPGALGRIKLNFKFIDVNFNYVLKNKQKGNIKFSRFLIKDINFQEKTAFELASEMNFYLDKKKSLGLDALLIGEFNLADFYIKEKIESFILVKLGNFRTKGISVNPPEIKAEIHLKADKKGEITTKVLADISKKSKLKATINMDSKKIKITDLSTDIHIRDFLSMVDQKKIVVSSGDSQFKLTGSILINSAEKFNIRPQLNFSISPEASYTLNALPIKTSMKGILKKNKLKIDFKNQLAEGDLNVLVKGLINLNRKPIWNKSNPFLVKVSSKNLYFKESFIKNLFGHKRDSSNSKTLKVGDNSSKKTMENKKNISFIPMKMDIKWKNIKLGKEVLSGNSLISFSSKAITTKKMKIRFLKGGVNLTHNSKFAKKSNRHSFDLKLKKLDISRMNVFFPAPFKNMHGLLNGSLGGRATIPHNGKKKYNIKVDILAKNGMLKGLKLGRKLG